MVASRVLAFPWGKVSTKLTDEGLQEVGKASCDALHCTVPHQALRSGCFPNGKTPRDALRLVQLTPCTGEPKARCVPRNYGGAGTPIHPPYFTTFPAASQARRKNFSPIFQKYVRACLNLSKMGRIMKKLTTLLSEDHFHECTRCKRRLQLAQVSAV